MQIGRVFTLRILSSVVAAVSSIIVARVLGPEQRGIFAAALVLPTTVAAFLDLGVSVSNVYFLNKSGRPGVLFINGMVFCSLMSLVFVAVCGAAFLLGIQKHYYQDVDDPWTIWLALSTAVLLIFQVFLRQFLRGLHSYNTPVASRIYHDVLRLAGILALLYLFNITVAALILIAFLALLIVNVYLLGALLRKISLAGARPDFAQFKQSLSYGLRHFLGNVLNRLNTKIDLLILAPFLEKEVLGVYAVAVALGQIMNFVPWAAGFVLYPKLAREHDKNRKREILSHCVTADLLLLLPAWLAFAVLGKWIVVTLYGEAYREVYVLTTILMGGSVLLSVVGLINKYFSGTGRPELSSLARLLNLPVKAAALYFLCRYFGVVGASLSFAVSSFVLLLITSGVYGRIVRRDNRKAGD